MLRKLPPIWFASAMLLVAASSPAAGQRIAQKPKSTVSQHAGEYNGIRLTYTATVSETLLPDAGGHPAASMVNIAYVRSDIAASPDRPVIFVFNGGPGSSSSLLHLSALGPKRIVSTANERVLDDNPSSPLDAADLVFVDPIGTGFSRPLPGVDGQPFWSVTGDANSVATFMRGWLRANHREKSPVLLCGESYGTCRAAQIVSTAKNLNIVGVVLISLVAGEPGRNLPYVLTFPTFAAVAAFHGRVDAAGRTAAEIFDEAERFARSDYLPALTQGKALPPDEKARIADEMAKRVGLPARLILEKNLRIDKSDFMLNLLRDKGLRTGQLDARVTGGLAEYAGKQPPNDDPSMFGNSPGRPTGEILQEYLAKDLSYSSKETYRTLNLDINRKWKYDADVMTSTPKMIGGTMKRRPRLRLLWAGGLYDLTTPLSAGRYALDHAGIPADRLAVVIFASGHGVYQGDENLARFASAVRAFANECR